MAHNIDFTRGKAAMFSRKELPWHGLGTILDQEIVTLEQALIASQLDFTVEKKRAAVITNAEAGEYIESEDYFATIRTDTNTILGIVGKDYTVVQNAQCFSFLDDLIVGCEATFETAGALGNGNKIFITAKVPSYLRLGNGDDIVEKYLFITNTHDGSGKVIVGFTPVRIVCNNTLTAALRGCRNKVFIKHTTSVHEKMDVAHMIMQTQNTYYDKLQEVFDALAGVNINDSEIRKNMCKIILSEDENFKLEKINFEYKSANFISTKKSNILDDILNTIEGGVGQELHRGTALWFINGVSSYYQNSREFRTSEAKLNFILDRRYTDNISNAIEYFTKL